MLTRKKPLIWLALLAAAAPDLASGAGPDCFCKSTVVVSAPVPFIPPTIWQGVYVGANAGGAWGGVDGHREDLFFPSLSPFFQTDSISSSGVVGGLQLGYNWQSSDCCLVAGLEADFGGMDIGIKTRDVFVAGTGGTSADFRTSGGAGWFATVTGRLGYNWRSTLIYGKGGVAWFEPDLHVRETVDFGTQITTFGNSAGGTLTGWTAGGGVESLITPGWSWKVEYLHFEFSNDNGNCCFNGARNFHFFNNDLGINTVRIGVNYLINNTTLYSR